MFGNSQIDYSQFVLREETLEYTLRISVTAASPPR